MTIDIGKVLSDNLTGEVSIRRYSGRGMYGKHCLAITGPNKYCKQTLVNVLRDLTQQDFDSAIDSPEDANDAYDFHDEVQDAIGILSSFEQDSMGMYNVVLYWPSIEYTKEMESNDNE